MSEILDEIKSRSAFALANDADSGCPDAKDSEGGLFLTRVRDSLLEQIDYHLGIGWTLADSIEEIRNDTHEIADGAPSIYTYTMWQQFVDLQAYHEDPTEYGDVEDMQKAAAICLYIIADRLVYTLLDQIESALADEVNDEDDE